MNWTDYQAKALSFVAVEGDLGEYIALGLLAEAGEVAGVYAKRVRGDDADFRARLLGELSDVCWFCAVGAHVLDVDLSQPPTPWHEDGDTHLDLVLDLAMAAYSFYFRSLFDDLDQDDADALVYEAIEAVTLCAEFEGFTVSEVLEYNIAKLTARQQAGTIRGSGEGVRR
jgi:hypothetical protein